MTSLSSTTLASLPAGIARPGHDPQSIRTGIVHFGPGAFHRAHQAAYVDRLLDQDPRWGIAAVSLRSASTVDALKAQDGLYTLAVIDREPSMRILAAHSEAIGPGEGPRLRTLLADRQCASPPAPSPKRAIAWPATAASIWAIPISSTT